MRISNDKTLSILEQARFIDELKNVRGMSPAEIAADLSRSKGWVSMRLSLLGEISDVVREKLFSYRTRQSKRQPNSRSGSARLQG